MTYISFPSFERRSLLANRRKTVHTTPLSYRTAGVIGGLGPLSTSLFYDTITKIFTSQNLIANPRLIINSVNTWEVTSILEQKDLEALYFFLKKEISLLAESIDFLVMVCNSVHAVLEPLRAHFGFPILSIYEEVCKEIALLQYRKVGILGTQTTINSKFYQSELQSYGIEYEVLPEQDSEILDHCIFQEILHGQGNDKMKMLLLDGIHYMAQRDCDAVILACTELPLFISQSDTEMPLFSSTEILAKVVVEECFR
ncbi:MAG: amino acid racemase [Saprospiraceae bacterium]|nr:amino acid racemase [Saprospiraceae bacterium]